MYCPYHGEDHAEPTPFTDEHVVPYALGGSDDLCIRVCKGANDRMGSEVDAPMLDNFFIASERLTRGIKGTGGSQPRWTFRGETEIGGKMVPATYSITPDTDFRSVWPLSRTGRIARSGRSSRSKRPN